MDRPTPPDPSVATPPPPLPENPGSAPVVLGDDTGGVILHLFILLAIVLMEI